MWQLLLGFVLTGFIGSYITFRYQKRAIEYQSFLATENDRINRLNDIKKRLNKLILHRAQSSKSILDLYQSIDKKITKNDRILYNIIRMDYIYSKDNWNYDINNIFIELGNLGEKRIYYYNAIYIDDYIHNTFRCIHQLICDLKKGSDSRKYDDAIKLLSQIYEMRKEIIRRLTREVSLIQSNIRYWNTVPLSRRNIYRASLIKLVLALFYKRPDLLRIPRS